MRVFLQAKNEKGELDLKKLIDLRKKSSVAERIALKGVGFNAEVYCTKPFTVEFGHNAFNKIPYNDIYFASAKGAIKGILVHLDIDEANIEVNGK